MSRARRLALLESAQRHDLLILEDDPYGSIYFEDVTTAADTRPIKADDTDGRVIYLGSFSKVLVPGLRVAWLVAPREIAQKSSWPSKPPISAAASSTSALSTAPWTVASSIASRRDCARTTRRSAA